MRLMIVPIVLVGRNRVSAVNRVSASRRIGTETLMDLCSANTLMNSNNEKQNQIKQQTNVYIWRFPEIWAMWVNNNKPSPSHHHSYGCYGYHSQSWVVKITLF